MSETDSDWVREELEQYQAEAPCEVCNGYRLKPEALSVKIGGLHIGQVCEQSIRDADGWFRDIDKKLTVAAARNCRAHSQEKSAPG